MGLTHEGEGRETLTSLSPARHPRARLEADGREAANECTGLRVPGLRRTREEQGGEGEGREGAEPAHRDRNPNRPLRPHLRLTSQKLRKYVRSCVNGSVWKIESNRYEGRPERSQPRYRKTRGIYGGVFPPALACFPSPPTHVNNLGVSLK